MAQHTVNINDLYGNIEHDLAFSVGIHHPNKHLTVVTTLSNGTSSVHFEVRFTNGKCTYDSLLQAVEFYNSL